jgi:hypothetical protein
MILKTLRSSRTAGMCLCSVSLDVSAEMITTFYSAWSDCLESQPISNCRIRNQAKVVMGNGKPPFPPGCSL